MNPACGLAGYGSELEVGKRMRKVRGHIHQSHPTTLYRFLESTLIVLARSLEPMIGPTPSDLQLTNGDSIRMLPMIGSSALFFLVR
jgi:hypothetical protein